MYQLVAERVEAAEDHTQHLHRIACAKRRVSTLFARLEACLPVFMADPAILEVPETFEHVFVVQQHANAAGKGLPNQFFQRALLVEIAKFLQERLKGFLFA